MSYIIDTTTAFIVYLARYSEWENKKPKWYERKKRKEWKNSEPCIIGLRGGKYALGTREEIKKWRNKNEQRNSTRRIHTKRH